MTAGFKLALEIMCPRCGAAAGSPCLEPPYRAVPGEEVPSGPVVCNVRIEAAAKREVCP